MAGYPNDQGNPAGAIPVYVVGGGGAGSMPVGLTSKGFQQITNPTVSTALPSIPVGATVAVLTPEANVRWRADGVAPTASVGNALWATSAFTVNGAANLAAFRLILMTGSATGVVNVQYY